MVKTEIAENDLKGTVQIQPDGTYTTTTYLVPSCFVKSDSWIYYIHPDDQKLYKILSNLTKKQIVINESIDNPFISSDGWIYYSIYRSNDYESKLYKVQLDGSHKTLLEDISNHEVEIAGRVYLYAVQKGYIFYNKTTDEGRYLYRMKTDGTQKIKLSEEETMDVKVSPDWIVYETFDDTSTLFKMKLDGSSKKRLNFKMGSGNIIDKEWIYYNNRSDGDKPYKFNINTEKNVRLSNEGSILLLTIYKGWLYYTYFGYNAMVYKTKGNFSDSKPVTSEHLDKITIIDNWMYYNLTDGSNKTFRLRLDGFGKQEV